MFDAIHESGKIHITMSATTPNIDEAEASICAFLAGHERIDLFSVRIILREALLNAVIHGSGEDATQVVRIEGALEASGMVLTVRDNGPGFPWRERRQDLDILADSGRGVALMHIYASTVRFNETGNEVTLYRKYECAPAPALAEGAGR